MDPPDALSSRTGLNRTVNRSLPSQVTKTQSWTEQAAHLLKALSHPIGFMIVIVLEREGCSFSAIAKEVPVDAALLRLHLQRLLRFGLINKKSDGFRVIYSLASQDARLILRALDGEKVEEETSGLKQD